MNRVLVLKAIADETRMKILSLLLKHNFCVRAIAGKLELSEGAISQQGNRRILSWCKFNEGRKEL